MDQILLGQLQQKICAELDIKVNVACRGFGLRDVQIQGLVKQFDGLFFVLPVSPADDCFQICVIGCFNFRITNFNQKLQLLACIFQLILLDFAVNHAIQWSLIRLVVC
jgi:hypothetical protein